MDVQMREISCHCAHQYPVDRTSSDHGGYPPRPTATTPPGRVGPSSIPSLFGVCRKFDPTVQVKVTAADRWDDAAIRCDGRALPTKRVRVDTLLTILMDFQPAGIVIILVAVASIVSNRLLPQAGPWAALVAIGGVAAFVGNRIMDMETHPAWLLPLAAVGAIIALGAGLRLVRAIQAQAYNDHTVGYVFTTALAIAAMWLSIALINFQATNQTVVEAITAK
jgi:hypothetical protein